MFLVLMKYQIAITTGQSALKQKVPNRRVKSAHCKATLIY
jgi:hypothetical protein